MRGCALHRCCGCVRKRRSPDVLAASPRHPHVLVDRSCGRAAPTVNLEHRLVLVVVMNCGVTMSGRVICDNRAKRWGCGSCNDGGGVRQIKTLRTNRCNDGRGVRLHNLSGARSFSTRFFRCHRQGRLKTNARGASSAPGSPSPHFSATAAGPRTSGAKVAGRAV